MDTCLELISFVRLVYLKQKFITTYCTLKCIFFRRERKEFRNSTGCLQGLTRSHILKGKGRERKGGEIGKRKKDTYFRTLSYYFRITKDFTDQVKSLHDLRARITQK